MSTISPHADPGADNVKATTNNNGSHASLMSSLAETITRETAIVEAYFQKQGGAQPGFSADSLLDFPNLPDEIQRARSEVLRATAELKDLVTGPTESVRWMAWNVS